MNATDQNGQQLRKHVRQDRDGTWSANVWFGSAGATNLRRYFGYPTGQAARQADISVVPPGGRIGEYSCADNV